MADLQEATLEVEEVKSTSEEKVKEPTASKVEPTIRSYTQKELDLAVGKGRASTQSLLSTSQAEVKKTQAEAKGYQTSVQAIEVELQDLQRQHDDLVGKQFADDPEARQAYISKRSIADKEKQVDKKMVAAETKLYEAEKLAWSAGMARKASELVKETSIETSELEDCHTEEEMEVKALRFKMSKEPEPEKKPEFDNLTSSGSGANLDDMTAKQLIQASIEKENRNRR